MKVRLNNVTFDDDDDDDDDNNNERINRGSKIE